MLSKHKFVWTLSTSNKKSFSFSFFSYKPFIRASWQNSHKRWEESNSQ